MSEPIADIYDDVSDFEDLLEAAEAEARTDFEMNLTEGIRNRYEKYQERMYLSEKQRQIIERIAKV